MTMSTTVPKDVLIIGAGHGGTATAVALRQHGFSGDVTVVGEEREHPYHRPPVSKAYLQDDAAPDLLRAPDYFVDNDIELILDQRVGRIDTAAGRAEFDGGAITSFDAVVLATGARARSLPYPIPRSGCWTLRTYSEAVAFRQVLREGARIVVVGGGFVGLEVAAAARERGCAVTVIERESALLQRIASPALSEAVLHQHQFRGVEVLLGAGLAGFSEDQHGRVRAVCLSDGTEFPCDAVVVGVGAEPRDELARAIGARCDGGILVDTTARTSIPGVYAVGDVTRRPVRGYPGSHRLESIPNAGDQAKQAAAAITGAAPPKPEVPWFWSDQYEMRIKIAGLCAGADHQVVRGDPQSAQFAVYHLDARHRVVAVEAMNSAGDFMAGRKWITAGVSLPIDRLPDPAIPLRDLASA